MHFDEMTARQDAQRQWSANPTLRAEFQNVDRWTAYSLAVARGAVKAKTAGGGVISMTAEQARAERTAVAPLGAAALAAAGLRNRRSALFDAARMPAANTTAAGERLVLLASPVELRAAPDGALPQRFSGTAYSGGLVPDYGVVIDLASTTYKPRLPLLDSHMRRDVVGVIERASTTDAKMVVSGRLFSDMSGSPAERIAQLAQRGAPFEMSVGLFAFTSEVVAAGRTVMVNGKSFSGPVTVLRNGQVREVSIVVLGADADTDAAFFGH